MNRIHQQAKTSRMAAMALTMLALFLTLVASVRPAQAQTFTVLYSFEGVNENEGAYPQGLVQGTDGNLYGVTEADGNAGEISSGTFFKITTSGKLTIICTYYNPGACRDAQAPSANLILGTNGDFYGVTLTGENIRMTPAGKMTVLSNSNGNSISVAPLVLASNGDFYGVTKLGGVNNNCFGTCGSVFKMTAAGKLTTLYSFCSVYQSGICTDGAEPVNALVQGSDGNLYGTTSIGGTDGVNDGYGTIFKITLAGALTTIYSFPGYTQSSSALVEGADGNFYGTTSTGGSGTYGAEGTFFTVTSGGALKTLYSFCNLLSCADGSLPQNIYLATDGNFYGITESGGATNEGTIFQITPGGTLATLHSFDGADGFGPGFAGTLMQDTNGTLYGTMQSGGAGYPSCTGSCVGTVFSLSMGLGPFVQTVPTSGKVKAAVKILGTHLKGATSVTFNGIAATFKVVSSSEITTTVPEGATSGEVQVVTPSGTLKSNASFQVP
ncbi:MAG: choice-of-anchor tandem repeat GloVer-containing protein [Terriglobales bacterium]|jgi:uncharacterized repeat protein (TIGR03803 family)